MQVYIGTVSDLRSIGCEVTVEAEYGKELVEGKKLTMAHHVVEGKCPCLYEPADIPFTPIYSTVVGISHLDLDTVGGLAAINGKEKGIRKPCDAKFWELAALVDLTGPHNPAVRAHERYPSLLAYWAWAEQKENRAPRPAGKGIVPVVTDVCLRHIALLYDIAGEALKTPYPTGSLHEAGAKFAAEEKELEATSFVKLVKAAGLTFAVRSAAGFTNHLYTRGDGSVVDGIVAFRTDFESITLSFRDDATRGPLHAAQIMQATFGPEAGGHPGIAGTPRNTKYTLKDVDKVLVTIDPSLAKKEEAKPEEAKSEEPKKE